MVVVFGDPWAPLDVLVGVCEARVWIPVKKTGPFRFYHQLWLVSVTLPG